MPAGLKEIPSCPFMAKAIEQAAENPGIVNSRCHECMLTFQIALHRERARTERAVFGLPKGKKCKKTGIELWPSTTGKNTP